MSEQQPTIHPPAEGAYDRLLAQFIEAAAAVLVESCTNERKEDAPPPPSLQKAA